MQTKHKNKINIYFTVTEMAEYMYYLLEYINSKLIKNKDINFKVISSQFSKRADWTVDQPKVLNSKFFKEIIWLNPNKIYNWTDLNLMSPDFYFQSGWNMKPFNHLAKITKQKNIKSKIILISDNNYQKNNIRQILGGIFFKFFLRKKFDLAWVPGLSGKKLMIKYGFEKKEVFTKLYSSVSKYYKNRIKVNKKKKQFLFVGQFIKRKNVETLIKVFKSLKIKKKEWKLIVVGKGNLNLKKYKKNNIEIFDPLPPLKLSKLYNQSIFFILPSLRDHWPLVVHEASLSGCFLLLSRHVGNIPELSNKKNSIIFDPNSKKDIQNTITEAISLSNKRLDIGNKESEILASQYNKKKSFLEFAKIINKFHRFNKKNVNNKNFIDEI